MNWRRNLWTLTLAVALSSSSYTMLIPFLPLYLLDIGVETDSVTVWSGYIFSVTFLVAAVMAPYWGRLADAGGKKRMVMRAGYSLAIVYFLGAFVSSPVELLMVRILQGFANGFVPASLAIAASGSPPQHLGFSLGIIQTGTLLGSIVGPLIGGTLSHYFGMRASFVIAAVIIAIGTTGVRLLVTEPAEGRKTGDSSIGSDIRRALGNRQLVTVLVLLFVLQTVTMVLQPLITLYVAQLQGGYEGVVLTSGIIFSLAGIAGAIAAPLWGRLGQHRGFRRILIVSFLGAGLFNGAQFFASEIVWFAVLQFLFGLFVVGAHPVLNTIAVSSVDEGFKGRIVGLLTTAYQLGGMTGPLLGGLLSAFIGIKWVFLFTGGTLLILAVAILAGPIGTKSVSFRQ